MSSDEASEARAEAEAFSWAEYRNEVAPNPRHAGREAVAFKAGFDAGATWQAGRDAERIAELEAEAERLRRLTEAQAERSADNLARAEAAEGVVGDLKHLHNVVATIKKTGGAVEVSGVKIEPCDERGATDTTRRAEAAESKLDAVREFCLERTEGYADDPFDFALQFALQVLAVLDGEEQS